MNRAQYIGATLESITHQLPPTVEVVIVDGGSKDGTEEVVKRFTREIPRIRFIRSQVASKPSNEGFDRDCDLAVECARGTYCWLFTDDDLLTDDAIDEALRQIDDGEPDVLIVDSEVRDLTMTRILDKRRLIFDGVRDYSAADADQFMTDAGNSLTFVGGVIIRRSVWMARDRASYYGTGFVHVCVIFQKPMLAHARVIGRPLVQIRMGNAAWTDRSFDIWMVKWPKLIWSFTGYAEEARRSVTLPEPWHKLHVLLIYRAYGSFKGAQYRDHLAARARPVERLAMRALTIMPGPIAHVAAMAMLSLNGAGRGSVAYNLLAAARHSNPVSRWIGRAFGHAPVDPSAKR